MEDILIWLQTWYERQCDGWWEDEYGVKIDTLGNPGWGVFIDLAGTELEGRPFAEIKMETDETDWFRCRLREAKFEGAGGPKNLRDILLVFRDWAEGRVE